MSEKKESESHNKGTVKTIAGSISGAFASFVCQPLDVIKTRQQQGYVPTNNNLQQLQPINKYKSTFATAKTIVTEESVFALWKGTAPTLYRVIPGAGINFFFLHHITTILAARHADKKLTKTDTVLAGGAARTLATILMLPITVVKTRFEGFGTNSYKNTFDALQTIARQEGLRGLFSGIVPSVLRDAPFAGLYYLFYRQTQEYLNSHKTTQTLPSTVINLASGGFAATLATVVTHPQDMIKTRLQLSSSSPSLTQAVVQIAKNEGIKGFYKGLTARLIRRPIANALTWAIYEEIVAIFFKSSVY